MRLTRSNVKEGLVNAPSSPEAESYNGSEERSSEDISDGEDVEAVVAAKKKRKVIRPKGPSVRTSQYRGVTHHVRTKRFEAHIWNDSRQIYLGGFNTEQEAALAYDLAALKFRGESAQTNHPSSNYKAQLIALQQATREEVVQLLRRQSKGHVKTSSQFRGVTKHAKGKWEARTGQQTGKKYKYLGLFVSETDAAVAYDRESVMRKGLAAITNFDLSEYVDLLSPKDLAEAEAKGLLGRQHPPALGDFAALAQRNQLPATAAAQLPGEAALQPEAGAAMLAGARSLPATTAVQEDFAGFELEPLSAQMDGYAAASHQLAPSGPLLTALSAPGGHWRGESEAHASKQEANVTPTSIFGWASTASADSASTPLGLQALTGPFVGATPQGQAAPELAQEDWLDLFSAAQEATAKLQLPKAALDPLSPEEDFAASSAQRRQQSRRERDLYPDFMLLDEERPQS